WLLSECRPLSAAFKPSRNPGSKLLACSLSISFLRDSMSKLPPQGSRPIPQVLYLFFGHRHKGMYFWLYWFIFLSPPIKVPPFASICHTGRLHKFPRHSQARQ